MAEALRHRERTGPPRKRQCRLFNLSYERTMRKLIRFTVNQNRPLTPVEMTEVNGGEIIPYECKNIGDKCAVNVVVGVMTGYCEINKDGALECVPKRP